VWNFNLPENSLNEQFPLRGFRGHAIKEEFNFRARSVCQSLLFLRHGVTSKAFAQCWPLKMARIFLKKREPRHLVWSRGVVPAAKRVIAWAISLLNADIPSLQSSGSPVEPIDHTEQRESDNSRTSKRTIYQEAIL
jgi:hypothetical protein